MLKALLLTRMRSIFSGMFRGTRSNKPRSIGFKILIGILVVYVLSCFLGIFGMLFYPLCPAMCGAGLNWFYFALAGLLSFLFCFVGSIFASQTQIYEAKDNELLLSMPIPPIAILASRITALLLLNYVYSSLVMLPAIVVYCIFNPVTFSLILFFIICSLLLPLMALALSCLFGWLMAFIGSKLRKKNIITLIFSLSFLLAYFYFYSKVQTYINILIQNGATIAAAVKSALFPIYHMGLAISSGNILSLLLFMLCSIAPFALVFLLLAKNFLKIATTNRGAAKIRYTEKALRVSSKTTALLAKDLRHFLNNSMYILNAALGCVFMLVLSGILIAKKDLLYSILAEFSVSGVDLSASGIGLPIIACLGLCFCSAMNFISAPSISLEAKTLWIPRSLPIKTGDILLSKARMHFVVALPFILVSAVICSIVLAATAIQTAVLFLVPLALSAFIALAGVELNLIFPKFDWISETIAIKQGVSSLICMLVSLGVIVFPIILYVTVFSEIITTEFYLLIFAVILTIFSYVLIYHLKTGGSRKLESL